MVDNFFPQTLLLLGLAVLVVLAFQRLYIPSSLAYLLVGVLLGPHTVGPVIDPETVQGLAEFGIVFLLFTIGLNFSLPHIRSMRHLLLGLGTAQVLLTTASVGVLLGLLGLPAPAAFVVGVVFAQSSTIIISKQLAEQGEDQSRHGRLAIAMSVFQTSPPFPSWSSSPCSARLPPGLLCWQALSAWRLLKLHWRSPWSSCLGAGCCDRCFNWSPSDARRRSLP